MNNFKKILNLMVVITILTIFSCTKEGKQGNPGLDGRNGTNGIDGINGINGANGTNGTNGTNGNANVIGTNTITLNSGDWIASGVSWYSNLTAAGITTNVVNTGTVQVFIQYGTQWWALPDINGINSTQFGFGVGIVTIFNTNSDGSQSINPGTKTFRVVIIPSSVRLANPNIDYTNYYELKGAFNLQE